MMELKVQMTIDVSDRLASILKALFNELPYSPHPVERERRYETPPPPPPPPPPPAEGKRGRGRPRKDEQPAAEQPAAEQPAAEPVDPNELWARAKLVAGSGKPHAQAIRDALGVMGVMRLSAVPPEKYPALGAFLDRLYEGEEIPDALAALTEEVTR